MNGFTHRVLGVALGLLLLLVNTSSLHSQPYTGVLLQAVKDAVRNLPPGFEALQWDGYPLVLFYDLDGDGMEDLFLLSTKKIDGLGTTDLKALSEYSRVFDGKAAQPYFLHIFLRRQTSTSLLKTIDLGSKRVFGSFQKFEIRHAARIPFGIEITFPNRVGLERVWVLVSSSSRIELFTFQEQHNVKSYVKDINGDGVMDLILFEDLFEDSLGYETYASWYQWDGTTYKRFRSVNILRNLRSFLSTIKQQILSKNWDAFFQYALQPQDASFAKGAGVQVALPRIFRVPPPPMYPMVGSETESIGIEILQRKFIDLIYPEILENPFNLREDGPESFLLTFRLVVEGDSFLLSTRVSMYKNFFANRLFYLVLQ
ncbi:MAG: hypothetical protein N2442_03555 [Spirochaetes bacterium]|nr:hypothetical protein [Spirochaetota bacterium]